MPRVPRLEKLFTKPRPWSRFPMRPPPFRFVEWETKEHKGNVRVLKLRPPSEVPKIAPYKEWPIIRGDLVEIMIGHDKGKQGKVRAVARKKNQLKVEGLNCSEQFIENMGDGKSGYLLNEEPLHYSEVKLVDPFTGKPTDVSIRFNEEGKQVRVCKESGLVIAKPPFERSDWKSRDAVKEGEFDTKADVVQQYTYVPSLLLFHEEIMKEMELLMTVPKGELERRDLIFREIENDVLKERSKSIDSPQTDTGIISQLQSMGKKMLFWRS